MQVQMEQDHPKDQLYTHNDTQSSHTMSSVKEQLVPVLQDPQHCHAIRELCLEQKYRVAMLPQEVQDHLMCSFRDPLANSDGAGTPNMSKYFVSNGQLLDSRFPLDPPLISGEIST